MSTVAERLVESWLDSQSERRYQPAFVQLLISFGWIVLHNTRHSPIEFGKDIIARSPSGTLYAIQLKGNPGGRLTKTGAQSMLPQLIELFDVPIQAGLKDFANEKHVALLVTNGEIDEEARLLIEMAGSRTQIAQSPSSGLEIWSRGTLLAMLRDKVGEIWPTSISGVRAILEFVAADGRSMVDPIKLSILLNQSVGRPSADMYSTEKTAKLAACFVLAEIIKDPWYRTSNDYVLYQISVIVAVYGIRYIDNDERKLISSSYDSVILSHCTDLLDQAVEKDYDPTSIWGERDILAEYDIMSERARLVADCAATIVLANMSSYNRRLATTLFENEFSSASIWGHSCVPSAIVMYWAYKRLDATPKPDGGLMAVVAGLIGDALDRDGRGSLAPPYYSFPQWLYVHSRGILGEQSDLVDDSSAGRTWFATAILYMLAKKNWKQTCKRLWPGFSKLLHEEVETSNIDFFDATLSTEGSTKTYQHYSTSWASLVDKAVNAGSISFLDACADRPWLVAAYIAIVPYRGWTPVIMWLDDKLGSSWYSREHLAV